MEDNQVPKDFDWEYYFEQNLDVKEVYGHLGRNGAEAHWKQYGYKENRIYSRESPQINNSIDQKMDDSVIDDIRDSEITNNKVYSISGKIVVYTAMSSDYDIFRELSVMEEGVDYIYFTDSNIQSNTWQIRPFPEFLKELDKTRKCRCLKVLPHIFLPEYEISVWVDANIEIMGNIREFVSTQLMEGSELATAYHPDRTCIYSEAEMVKKLGKDDPNEVDRQIDAYKKEKFPSEQGLVQTQIIVREHLTEGCKKFCKEWWEEILNRTKRDQLSFNYVLWKNLEIKIKLFNPNIIVSKYFQIRGHKKTNPTNLPKGYGDIQNYIRGIKI